MTEVSLVVAVSRNGVIGVNGGLPWHISSDLKRFKEITLGKPVIMGRKTWDSLPRKPLAGRRNIVVTRQQGFAADGAEVVHAAAEALTLAGDVPEVCIIGGGEIYRQFMGQATRIYLTEVDLEVAGDTRLPRFAPEDWKEVDREVHAAGTKDSAGFTLRVLERV